MSDSDRLCANARVVRDRDHDDVRRAGVCAAERCGSQVLPRLFPRANAQRRIPGRPARKESGEVKAAVGSFRARGNRNNRQ